MQEPSALKADRLPEAAQYLVAFSKPALLHGSVICHWLYFFQEVKVGKLHHLWLDAHVNQLRKSGTATLPVEQLKTSIAHSIEQMQ